MTGRHWRASWQPLVILDYFYSCNDVQLRDINIKLDEQVSRENAKVLKLSEENLVCLTRIVQIFSQLDARRWNLSLKEKMTLWICSLDTINWSCNLVRLNFSLLKVSVSVRFIIELSPFGAEILAGPKERTQSAAPSIPWKEERMVQIDTYLND